MSRQSGRRSLSQRPVREGFLPLETSPRDLAPNQNADRRSRALKEMARCARHARDLGAARLAWEEILATCQATGSVEGEVEAQYCQEPDRLPHLAPIRTP